MVDFARLQQESDQAWTYARQARAYNRMARARAILTRQEVRRAYQQALTAYLALSMPKADPWTRDITATILVSRGLLDEQPPIKSPPAGHHRRDATPTSPAKSRPG
jgi:hypothetical protein